MASKTLKTRLKQKRDSSANWAKATNFTPLAGEIIVYSDLNMIKIGDGTTKVSALPFLKGNNTVDLSNYVPYTGATKDVVLGKHSLLISNKSSNTGNPTIKVSAKGVSEDDIYTIIDPNGITMGDPTTTTATLGPSSLKVNDGPLTGAVVSSGLKASFDNSGSTVYSIYKYDGIDHNGKKLAFPTKAGTIALLSDIPSVPSLDGYVPYSGGNKNVVLEKNNNFVTSYNGYSTTIEPTQVKIDFPYGSNKITYEGIFIDNTQGSTYYKRRGITVDNIEWLFPNVSEATSSSNVFVVRSDLGTQVKYNYDSSTGTLAITTK